MYRLPDDHDADVDRPASLRFLRNVEALRAAQAVFGRGAATDAEREALRLYTGFGDADVAKLAFGYDGRAIGGLAALGLAGDWIAGVRRAVLDAFYTPVAVVDAMWDIARRFGGLRGKPLVLEPSCGAGVFLGRAPASLSASSFVCVELDRAAAAVCGALYPGARIAAHAFEDVAAQLPTFDLAIGNVPFGQRQVPDFEVPAPVRATLHDYFVGRCLLSLRRGGLAVLLTSTGTLDKVKPAARAWMAQRAELVLAVRLPSGSFLGTEADADLLVLRRREVDLAVARDPWVVSERLGAAGDRAVGWRDAVAAYPELAGVDLNRVFVEQPNLAAGSWAAARNQYKRVEPVVEWPDDQLLQQPDRPARRRARSAWLRSALLERAGSIRPADPETSEEASRGPVEAPELEPPTGGASRLERAATRLLGALRSAIAAQRAGSGEDELRALRAVHADFVRRFGRVRAVDTKLFRGTELGRAWALLVLLEEDDGSPGPALRRRFVAGLEHGRRLDLVEALYAVIDRRGRVDVAEVADIMNSQEAA